MNTETTMNANHDRPLKRRAWMPAVPKAIKPAVEGYIDELPPYTTVSDLVENDPEVKKLIDEMNNLEWQKLLPAREKPHSLGPTPGIPQKVLAERNEYIVGLWLMGLSSATIHRSANAQAAVRGWSVIEHERSIKRIITDYYNAQRPSTKDAKAYQEGLKEATFAAQERLVEKMAIYVSKRPESSWKPFEYMAAMETIARVRQQLVENRNWNASRMNPLIALTQSTQLNVFEEGSQGIVTEPSPALKRITAYLREKVEE